MCSPGSYISQPVLEVETQTFYSSYQLGVKKKKCPVLFTTFLMKFKISPLPADQKDFYMLWNKKKLQVYEVQSDVTHNWYETWERVCNI